MIDDFLVKHGITEYRLAKLLGKTQTTVARWRKDGTPDPVMLGLALERLGQKIGLIKRNKKKA